LKRRRRRGEENDDTSGKGGKREKGNTTATTADYGQCLDENEREREKRYRQARSEGGKEWAMESRLVVVVSGRGVALALLLVLGGGLLGEESEC
jgi:hypothetical protein